MKKVLCFALLLLIFTFPSFAKDTFKDIDPDSWYYDSVIKLSENECIAGTGENTFSPNKPLTRSEAVCVLSKVCKWDKNAENPLPFIDCNENSWAYKYIQWAYDNEIAQGYNNMFYPDRIITREEFCVMLKKAAELTKSGNKFKTGLSKDMYEDYENASSWAKESIEYSLENGYISGTSKNKLTPKSTITRAMMAVCCANLYDVINQGFLTPDDSFASSFAPKNYEATRIVCWGDSMTASPSSDECYPTRLKEETKMNVLNYGVGGETAEVIAMRQGAIDVYVAPVTIPESSEVGVPVRFYTKEGKKVDFGYFGFAGINICSINGAVGTISYSQELKSSVFTRVYDDTPMTITKLTKVLTYGMKDRSVNDINIIFTGTNNCYNKESCKDLPKIIDKMIEYSGSDKYLIIGLTSKEYAEDVAEINEYLSDYYKDNFLDIRTYFLTKGLEDAGITPTEQDLADIAYGEIPSSLRSDTVHGTPVFYKLLAHQVYLKLLDMNLIQ